MDRVDFIKNLKLLWENGYETLDWTVKDTNDDTVKHYAIEIENYIKINIDKILKSYIYTSLISFIIVFCGHVIAVITLYDQYIPWCEIPLFLIYICYSISCIRKYIKKLKIHKDLISLNRFDVFRKKTNDSQYETCLLDNENIIESCYQESMVLVNVVNSKIELRLQEMKKKMDEKKLHEEILNKQRANRDLLRPVYGSQPEEDLLRPLEQQTTNIKDKNVI